MSSVAVRYTVRDGRGDENQALVEGVFAELAREGPAGLRYTAFRGEDGVSFLHVVTYDAGDAGAVLRSLPAFQLFREGLNARCAEPPVRLEMHEVGAYDCNSPLTPR
jgi:hypothetical protein